MITIPLLAATFFLHQEPPLHVSMISLGVKDMTRSVQFYRDTLEMPVLDQPSEITMIDAGSGLKLALNRPLGTATAPASTSTEAVEVVFGVRSVAASYKRLRDRGCKFSHEPHEVTAGVWAATFNDPDGHRLTILGGR
jgi:predicted enzyme related to lactoylglutathione lyase